MAKPSYYVRGSGSAKVTRKGFIKTVGAGVAAAGLARAGMAKGQSAELASPQVALDTGGSRIGAVRMDVSKSYDGVPELLAAYVQSGETDGAAWAKIRAKIDYTYECIHHALKEVVLQDSVKSKIKTELQAGKKLLFKPNIVNPQVFDMSGSGTPGPGILANTDWVFLAALMRWFHDKLDISYASMAVGEAGSLIPPLSAMFDSQFAYFSGQPGGQPYRLFTPEALMEGRFPMPAQIPGLPYPNYYAGYPFYFVRKYLSEAHDPAHTDDPMSGYLYSLCGNKAGANGYPDPSGAYLPPGMRNYLSVEELDFTESPDRGRVVMVPGGGVNFPDGIEVHKTVVGDPADAAGYPGCVLVNVPKLKVHDNTMLTNAIKNTGIGLYPTGATEGADPHGYRYSYPHRFPHGMKNLVPHVPWVLDVFEDPTDSSFFLYGGMPDFEKGPRQTAGLQGTMTDIDLAVCNNYGNSAGKSMVALALHVSDSVVAANVDHVGLFAVTGARLGLALVSLDPVALDMFCANHMSKNVPREVANSYGLEFALGVPMPRFDQSYRFLAGVDPSGNPVYRYGAIVTDPGLDSPVLRDADMAFAEAWGLGSRAYHVAGMDKTSGTNASLATKNGHLGKVERNAFVEIVFPDMFFDYANMIRWLQGTTLSYSAATDSIPGGGSAYAAEFLALDSPEEGGNGDTFIDFTEHGKKGTYQTLLAVSGIGVNFAGTPGDLVEHLLFYINSRMLKYSDSSWNAGGIDSMKLHLDGIAVAAALSLAYGPEAPDAFFGIPHGTGADGMAKWPSLQFARYLTDMSLVYGSGGLYLNAASAASIFSQVFGIPVSFRLYVPGNVPYAPGSPYNPYGLGYGGLWGASMFPQSAIDPQRVAELSPDSPDYAKYVFTVAFLGPDGSVLVNPMTGAEMRW